MTDLVIKNLNPNQTTKILLEGILFGEVARSNAIEITPPKACPKINTVDITYTHRDTTNPKLSGSTFGFYKYSKGSDIDSSRFRMRFYFDSKKPKNKLKVGDQATFITSDSTLSSLNGKTGTVLESKAIDSNKIYIIFSLPITAKPTQNIKEVNSSNNSAKERVGTVRTNTFIVSTPPEVYQNLVRAQEKSSIVDSSWAIRDIPIYAYRNFDGKIRSSDKLLSMYNDAEIKNDTPPAHSSGLEDAFQQSCKVEWEIGDKPNYLFYVTIARYTKKNGTWTGEWLQVNSAGKPIWAKAKKV